MHVEEFLYHFGEDQGLLDLFVLGRVNSVKSDRQEEREGYL